MAWGRRIVQKAYSRTDSGVLDATYDYYYNEQWQVLQVRKNGPPRRTRSSCGIRTTSTRRRWCTCKGQSDPYYYTHDANYNVTALLKYNAASGGALRVHALRPGDVPRGANWSVLPQQKSTVGNPHLFTGRQLDPETGLYQYRHRYYDPQLGRFVSRDPIGYEGANGTCTSMS